MLTKPSIDELEKRTDMDRYALVHLASRRARDIKEGLRFIGDEAESKELSQAAKEISEDRIRIKNEGKDEE